MIFVKNDKKIEIEKKSDIILIVLNINTNFKIEGVLYEFSRINK